MRSPKKILGDLIGVPQKLLMLVITVDSRAGTVDPKAGPDKSLRHVLGNPWLPQDAFPILEWR